MSRFIQLTLDEFADLLQRFNFTRRIDTIHMHHTWRPNHGQYRGEASIEAMWRFHTREMGWRDIAQHVSIAPDGAIWTGRDWNLPPASAVGFNGSAAVGPFMFETIGDFDRGADRLEGAQREAVIGVIARVQERFGLTPDSLRFHRSMTNAKSCPGTSIDLDDIRAAVEAARSTLGATRSVRRAPMWAAGESLRGRGRVDEALGLWQRAAPGGRDASDAEPPESAMSDAQAGLASGASGFTRSAPGAAGRAARGPQLTPEMLSELRPHVVNLNQGRFSDEGLFRTTRADVDAIFDEHLVRAADRARAEQRPLRLLFWAHGGLISESSGLWIAHQQAQWWMRNGVYPIHFVWETGLLDALRQILSGARRPAARGVPRDLWDHTTDPAVEGLVRTLGGDKIWSAMKRSAELASDPHDGGAAYVAGKLAAFCQSPPCAVELHAVGHSAGSIFHAYFLPAAFAAGVPAFKTLQLLAPAIRVDTFKDFLLGLVPTSVEKLTMFTMKRDWEEDDHVVQVYRKSLLYLIHHALERKRETPLLGLEMSVREDRDLVALFGPSSAAEIVWSVSEATSGPSASTSHSHGGFDNDRPTMDAVAHRVLNAPPAVTFPDEAIERGRDVLTRPSDLPFAVEALLDPADGGAPTIWDPAPSAPPSAAGAAGPGGGRRALCVGIDGYPTMPLAGCVADAREWSQALQALGFRTATLLDADATRGRILDELKGLIGASRAGDVLVFQFAGHGTELEDLDGDEVDGTNGPRDEALCPYDIAQGAFVIDDDLAEVFDAIPADVNLTCFIDCCHSGTITRLMVGPPSGDDGRDRRARFLPATPELQAAHRRFREQRGRGRAPRRSQQEMRQVVFSACRDYEVAFESDGHGEFTVRSTRVLTGGLAGLTHDEFQRRVTAAFGDRARQHPELDCAPSNRTGALLAPLGGAAAGDGRGRAAAVLTPAALAHALRAFADGLAPGS